MEKKINISKKEMIKLEKCLHKSFSYDADTDVTYCNDCGSSLFCGNLYNEIFNIDSDFENEIPEGY
jgi:hypothetical protein